ncbi:hypothetical protein [Phyllobacterium myrsinacearum]|uniref:Uncharacterized protein n=1 Tax=Phyllobacterium myrsinacearum TaxID=28101 RepID=A0A839ELL3_9HYPH|nr:hypothetical protein [Phyllobacterium myrsinacearum]MBA8880941.1 hypothetical protein [Phyllobacterium myrsinacearum]
MTTFDVTDQVPVADAGMVPSPSRYTIVATALQNRNAQLEVANTRSSKRTWYKYSGVEVLTSVVNIGLPMRRHAGSEWGFTREKWWLAISVMMAVLTTRLLAKW